MVGTRWLAFLALCAALGVLVVPAPAAAEGVPVDQATAEQKEDARKAFVEARKAYDERRFQDALGGFRSSYHIVASPNTRVMIAHTLRELGRNADAHREFELAIEEAEAAAKADAKYAESASKARAKQEALRPKVGLLEVTVHGVDDDAVLRIAGNEIERARWGKPVAVEPGQVTITLTTGGDSLVQDVKALAGKTTPVTLGEGPPSEEGEGSDEAPSDGTTQRTFAYVAAGIGAAAFLTAGVFGTLAQVTYNDLEDDCGVRPCGDRRDDITQGQTYKTVTNVMVVVGAVAMTTGVVLYFTSPGGPFDDTATVPSWSVALGPGSLTVGGTF
ncbi:MAG: hypothetical protein JRI68_31955 [Deltaproteobacteria bacterium]|nr:hypothetical protein [Deltaproteobacteria bacterium]